MKWEQFENMMEPQVYYTDRVETNIECPECGKNLFMRTDIILTTDPVQYQYECKCGFTGYSFARWSGRR